MQLNNDQRRALQQLLLADDRPVATLGDVIDRYEIEHVAVDGLAPGTLQRIRLGIRRLTEWRSCDISQPWRPVAAELYKRHGEIPGSCVTNVLSRLLNLARRWGLRVEAHDLAGLAKIRSRPRTAIVATEHREVLLAELLADELPWKRNAADCALFIVYTTTRVSEACTIERDHVSLVDRFVMLPKTKNGKARCVPLCDEAVDIVRPRMKRGRYVFRAVMRDVPMHRRHVLAAFADAAARAGIPHVHPHKIRHTFATEAKLAGIDIEDVSVVFGTSPEEIRRSYQHVAPASAMATMRAIADRWGKCGGDK